MASRRGLELDGVLLLDKPEGLSSNHALQRAKRTLNARKMGHTGTLDPFATGLLVCCAGRATKISALLLDADKTYEAVIKLGEETDSGDLTGHVVSSSTGYESVTEQQMEAALAGFRGEIQQVPPMYSALKRDGKPLYVYARQGVEVERAPRSVTIHRLELLDMGDAQAHVLVHCSKGTYIRTLAQDIGRVLGCGAHLSALRRTRVGPFRIEDAVGLEVLQAHSSPQKHLIAPQDLPEGLWPANLKLKDQL